MCVCGGGGGVYIREFPFASLDDETSKGFYF